MQPSGEPMEAWQVMERIIPHGKRKALAYHMHISVDWVNRWCIASDTRSGQPGPLERLCQMHDGIFLFNPLGSALIPEFINNHRRLIVEAHAAQGFGNSETRRESAAEILQKAVTVVNSLNLEAATNHTLECLIELREVCNRDIARAQVELSKPERQTEAGIGPRRIS